MMRGVTLEPRLARVARDLIASRLLGLRRVSDLLAGNFAGTEIRYARRRGQHPLVGTRATEVPLVGKRLTEVQRRPGFVLIRPRNSGPVAAAEVVRVERTDDGPALLVRPDGYIAWAGTPTDGGWVEELRWWTGVRAAVVPR